MLELPAEEYRALVADIARALTPAQVAAAPTLASSIEYTLLRADATAGEIDGLCDEAVRRGFAAVCVNPAWVARAAARLRPTPVLVTSVVGFPLGASSAAVKLFEAAECLKLGADELDVVINIGALKSGADATVDAELRGITHLAHTAGAKVKAILELGLLSEDEKSRAANLAIAAGVDYLKTSTGFQGSSATPADVALLRTLAAGRAAIKAAGGIRTRAQAEALLAAGTTRLGTSALLTE